MNSLNNVLKRQIKKYYGKLEAVPENLEPLLKVISQSYDHYEKDRNLLERSLELSSQEMIELHNGLRRETDQASYEISQKLQESLIILDEELKEDDNVKSDFQRLSNLAERLKEETKKRKEAENHIKQNESFLSISQHIAKIGSWMMEINAPGKPEDQLIYWSDEINQILGYPLDEQLTVDHFLKRTDPDNYQTVRDAFIQAFENGYPLSLKFKVVIPRDGEKIVFLRSEILADSQIKYPLKVLGTIQDISAWEKDRKQLKEANKNLNLLFENMGEVFFSIDYEKQQLLQMSSACEDVYGYSKKEFAANMNLWFEIVLEEDRKAIQNNEPDLQRGGTIVNTYRIHHKNGQIRWLESKITPTLNAQGKLARMDGVTADITQRKQAEKALEESERKFRALIERSSDAIIVVDKDARVIYASDSVFNITGYSAKEIIGEYNLDYVYQDDLKDVYQKFTYLVKHPGEPISLVYRRLKKDGSYFWCESSVINLLEEPAVGGIVANFRNITERKNYEEALKKTNKKLQKSNEELDRFVYSVSHDLRAPLSSMLGVIQFMEADLENKPHVLHDVHLLKSSVLRLDDFIQEILDYSRNARLTVESEEIKFGELLEEAITNLSNMDRGNENVKISYKVQNGFAFYSDKRRVKIVLNNLISNAIRYSNKDAKYPFVKIAVSQNIGFVRIIVEDNGVGISQENQQKVFEMFYRISEESTGSGLGLYIVKETIDKLKGSIRMESDIGKGTKFIIDLPNRIENE